MTGGEAPGLNGCCGGGDLCPDPYILFNGLDISDADEADDVGGGGVM